MHPQSRWGHTGRSRRGGLRAWGPAGPLTDFLLKASGAMGFILGGWEAPVQTRWGQGDPKLTLQASCT